MGMDDAMKMAAKCTMAIITNQKVMDYLQEEYNAGETYADIRTVALLMGMDLKKNAPRQKGE